MGDYACQDCERCSRSGISTLLRGAAALMTLGMSEIAIGVYDFVQRTCPGCGHPMSEHTLNRVLYEQPLYPRSHPVVQQPMPTYPCPTHRFAPHQCQHTRWTRTQSGFTGCYDCGGMWDPHGRPM